MDDDDYALVTIESGKGAVVVSHSESGEWLVYAPGWPEVIHFQTRLQAITYAEDWLHSRP